MKIRLQKRIRVLKRQFRRFLARKISNRLILSYIGLAVVPIVLISVYLIRLSHETVQEYIHQRNLETARRASNEINLFIKGPLTILQIAALSREMTDADRFSRSNLINRIKQENEIFRKIFVVNDSGRVTVTTRFGEEDSDFATEPFFLQARGGFEYISEVSFTASGFPVFLIAEPIVKYNQIVGVLAAEIDLNNIWNLVDRIRIEQTGFAFVLSEKGQVIAHQNKEKVLKRVSYADKNFYKRLRAGEQGILTNIMDDEENILAFVPVEDLAWGVVVQQSQYEAFSLARQMQSRVIFFAALMAIVALILGIFFVQRFTDPLNKLVLGARTLGSGNLEHKIESKSHDELGELAQEFNSMAHSLAKNQRKLKRMEHLAALSRFASLVSHEIRNPLNAMNINMQILKRIVYREDVSKERKSKYLNILSSEITRINDLVTKFLSIARQPELTLTPVELTVILDEVVELQLPHARRLGIPIERHYNGHSLPGRFDSGQIKQVFLNLVINALEAMEDGGVLHISAELKTEELPDGDSISTGIIEFRDNGEGIPKEILNEVFEYYYTTKRAGTGLGLALAKQIVEAHKGSVYINSKPNAGTSVFVELPVNIGN